MFYFRLAVALFFLYVIWYLYRFISLNKNQISSDFGVDHPAFETYQINESLFKKILASAPKLNSSQSSNTNILLPFKDKLYEFELFKSIT